MKKSQPSIAPLPFSSISSTCPFLFFPSLPLHSPPNSQTKSKVFCFSMCLDHSTRVVLKHLTSYMKVFSEKVYKLKRSKSKWILTWWYFFVRLVIWYKHEADVVSCKHLFSPMDQYLPLLSQVKYEMTYWFNSEEKILYMIQHYLTCAPSFRIDFFVFVIVATSNPYKSW